MPAEIRKPYNLRLTRSLEITGIPPGLELGTIVHPMVMIGDEAPTDRVGLVTTSTGAVAINTDYSAVRPIQSGTYQITGSIQWAVNNRVAPPCLISLQDRPLGSVVNTFGRVIEMAQFGVDPTGTWGRAGYLPISIPKLYVDEGREVFFYLSGAALIANDIVCVSAIFQKL